MPLDEAQWPLIRSWIGTVDGEDDDTFNERLDRLGSVDAAILESLRSQLAALTLDQPAGLSTPDGLNVQVGENIRSIQQLIKDFNAIGGTDPATVEAGGTNVTSLSRPMPR